MVWVRQEKTTKRHLPILLTRLPPTVNRERIIWIIELTSVISYFATIFQQICFLRWMNVFSILACSAEWHHPYIGPPQECFLSPTMALVGPASEPPAIRLTLTWPLQWTHRVVIVYYSVRVILPFLSIHRDTPSANCQGQMLTALATETHFSNFCHNWLMTKPTVFIYNV